jgi:hypothetical protein
VVSLFIVAWLGEPGHPDVTRVQWCNEAADGTALARGIPPLEHHAHRGADPLVAQVAAEHQAEVEQALLGQHQPCLLLSARHPQVQVDVDRSGHATIQANVVRQGAGGVGASVACEVGHPAVSEAHGPR